MPFLYHLPREAAAGKWICDTWDIGYPTQMHESVTATFVQALGT